MLRKTKQRSIIMDILRETRNHPTAEEIYLKARLYMPKISLSTVYRTLRSLVEEGKILEIKVFGENHARYDYPLEQHQHFYCRKCKELIDLYGDFYYPNNIPHKVEEIRTIFIGVCKDCLKEENDEKVWKYVYCR